MDKSTFVIIILMMTLIISCSYDYYINSENEYTNLPTTTITILEKSKIQNGHGPDKFIETDKGTFWFKRPDHNYFYECSIVGKSYKIKYNNQRFIEEMNYIGDPK